MGYCQNFHFAVISFGWPKQSAFGTSSFGAFSTKDKVTVDCVMPGNICQLSGPASAIRLHYFASHIHYIQNVFFQYGVERSINVSSSCSVPAAKSSAGIYSLAILSPAITNTRKTQKCLWYNCPKLSPITNKNVKTALVYNFSSPKGMRFTVNIIRTTKKAKRAAPGIP